MYIKLAKTVESNTGRDLFTNISVILTDIAATPSARSIFQYVFLYTLIFSNLKYFLSEILKQERNFFYIFVHLSYR